MQRDGNTVDEARRRIKECRELIQNALDTNGDPEQVLADELGLEPDYITDIL